MGDLETFLGSSRWFAGHGRAFTVRELRRVGVLAAGGQPEVTIELAEVEYDDGGRELYQLPLAYYRKPQRRLAHARIGVWDDTGFGARHVYDAVHDRTAMAAWLRGFAGAGQPGPLRFERVADHQIDLSAHSTLLTGEQSNSSVAFGDDSLLKVFRRVAPGSNPDIVLHAALTRGGSEHVASLYGWLETGSGGELVQLATLQQFLRTASDGWELALASVRDLLAEGDLHAHEVGGDFAPEATRLGEAVAEIHRVLGTEFPAGSADGPALAARMRRQLDEARSVVPELARFETVLTETFAEVARLPAQPVQRIHGDLHLGQTLRTVKGWKIVDFEGEPDVPLADRSEPDARWRDVAGMLRSFDYVPAAAELTHVSGTPEEAAQRARRGAEWSARNQSAFLDAYAPGGLSEEEQVLLTGYLAEKAVYEAAYETRHRPGWVAIPLAGLERLTG